METFEKHRIFDVQDDWSTRRCMTAEEMHAAGWEYSEPMITFHINGRPYKKATPTWAIPMSEKKKEEYANLSRRHARSDV